MSKQLFFVGTMVIVLLFVFVACESAPETPPTPTLPEFEIESLAVMPLEIEVGETAKITAIVKNVGGSAGTYAVSLSVDGVIAEVKETASISPGSSSVVDFYLTQNTSGSYEVSIGNLSQALFVREKLTAKKVELKYDDGEPTGYRSQGPGWGYSTRFSPPGKPFTINKVKIMTGSYEGTKSTDAEALLEIWNGVGDVSYSQKMLATEYLDVREWVTFEPNIVVEDDFRIVFFPNGSKEAGGFVIGYDTGAKNEGSEVARSGGQIVDWIEVWETGDHPMMQENTNWLIRVVGTYMALAD